MEAFGAGLSAEPKSSQGKGLGQEVLPRESEAPRRPRNAGRKPDFTSESAPRNGGRPKGSVGLTSKLRQCFQDGDADVAMRSVRAIIKQPDHPHFVKILALAWDRLEGPVQRELMIRFPQVAEAIDLHGAGGRLKPGDRDAVGQGGAVLLQEGTGEEAGSSGTSEGETTESDGESDEPAS